MSVYLDPTDEPRQPQQPAPVPVRGPDTGHTATSRCPVMVSGQQCERSAGHEGEHHHAHVDPVVDVRD